MQIKCDKCSAVAESVMPETFMEGDIEFTFFRCPACGEVYPVCATDAASIAEIASSVGGACTGSFISTTQIIQRKCLAT